MLTSTTPKRGASGLGPNDYVAYFCAEYGITDKLPIYSGGLGVLAGDIVQEAAAQKLPFVAVGLFYKKGYFHQFVDSSGQHESTSVITPAKVPLHLAVDEKGETVLIEVPIQERIVYAQIWRFAIGETSLFLLDTDHWKNSEADRSITDQLYAGDQTRRIQQELILAIGGYRALERLGITPTIFHMNEGHSAFLSLELISKHMKADMTLEAAKAAARQQLIFTNHTLVAAGNDAFPHDMVKTLLGKYAFDSGVGIDTVINLGDAPEKPGNFSMTMLALRMSRKSNAVSKLHAKKAKDLWPDFKLEAVTNGVHLPQWVAKEWQDHWNTLMPDWKTNTADPKMWRALNKLSDADLWSTHLELKRKLLDKVYDETGVRLEEDVLTIVWARRFATYKRPDLLFNDIERLKQLVFSSDRPIQIIVAGKSHPADQQGKDIIAHIEYLANYDLKRRAVFVDDYSISLAKYLVAGADVWLNTPIFGLEASGTSGMKAAANGAIQFTTPDGWAYEVDWYGLGYALPIHKAETHIYSLFEKKIIPTFYKQDKQGIPKLWVAMMRDTMATVSPMFSSTRMVNEYVSKMYGAK
jgi:starch phosphorylase